MGWERVRKELREEASRLQLSSSSLLCCLTEENNNNRKKKKSCVVGEGEDGDEGFECSQEDCQEVLTGLCLVTLLVKLQTIDCASINPISFFKRVLCYFDDASSFRWDFHQVDNARRSWEVVMSSLLQSNDDRSSSDNYETAIVNTLVNFRKSLFNMKPKDVLEEGTSLANALIDIEINRSVQWRTPLLTMLLVLPATGVDSFLQILFNSPLAARYSRMLLLACPHLCRTAVTVICNAINADIRLNQSQTVSTDNKEMAKSQKTYYMWVLRQMLPGNSLHFCKVCDHGVSSNFRNALLYLHIAPRLCLDITTSILKDADNFFLNLIPSSREDFEEFDSHWLASEMSLEESIGIIDGILVSSTKSLKNACNDISTSFATKGGSVAVISDFQENSAANIIHRIRTCCILLSYSHSASDSLSPNPSLESTVVSTSSILSLLSEIKSLVSTTKSAVIGALSSGCLPHVSRCNISSSIDLAHHVFIAGFALSLFYISEVASKAFSLDGLKKQEDHEARDSASQILFEVLSHEASTLHLVQSFYDDVLKAGGGDLESIYGALSGLSHSCFFIKLCLVAKRTGQLRALATAFIRVPWNWKQAKSFLSNFDEEYFSMMLTRFLRESCSFLATKPENLCCEFSKLPQPHLLTADAEFYGDWLHSFIVLLEPDLVKTYRMSEFLELKSACLHFMAVTSLPLHSKAKSAIDQWLHCISMRRDWYEYFNPKALLAITSPVAKRIHKCNKLSRPFLHAMECHYDSRKENLTLSDAVECSESHQDSLKNKDCSHSSREVTASLVCYAYLLTTKMSLGKWQYSSFSFAVRDLPLKSMLSCFVSNASACRQRVEVLGESSSDTPLARDVEWRYYNAKCHADSLLHSGIRLVEHYCPEILIANRLSAMGNIRLGGCEDTTDNEIPSPALESQDILSKVSQSVLHGGNFTVTDTIAMLSSIPELKATVLIDSTVQVLREAIEKTSNANADSCEEMTSRTVLRYYKCVHGLLECPSALELATVNLLLETGRVHRPKYVATYSMLVEEPLLVFRLPLSLLSTPLVLDIALFIFKSLSSASASASEESIRLRGMWRSGGGEAVTVTEFLNVQDLIAIRVLLEMWSELSRQTCEGHQNAEAEGVSYSSYGCQSPASSAIASSIVDFISSLVTKKKHLLAALLHYGITQWEVFCLLSSSDGLLEEISKNICEALLMSLKDEADSPLSASPSAVESWMRHVIFLLRVHQSQQWRPISSVANKWICKLVENLLPFFNASISFSWWHMLPIVGSTDLSECALSNVCMILLRRLCFKFSMECYAILTFLTSQEVPCNSIFYLMKKQLVALQSEVSSAFCPQLPRKRQRLGAN